MMALQKEDSDNRMNRPPGVIITVLMLVLLVSGCSSSSRKVSLPSPTVIDRSPQSQQPQLPQSDQEVVRILALLDEADQAMADKRLTTPEHYNAWSFYQRVLMLQPENAEARQGLDKIVERYLAWSRSASQRGKLSTARLYLQRASLVNPEYPALKQAKLKLQSQPKSESKAKAKPKLESTGKYIQLNAAAVKARSRSAQQKIRQVADVIRANDARVVIEAPNDLAGRWIYQQLNRRHEDYRVRANMKIEQRPAIRLLY